MRLLRALARAVDAINRWIGRGTFCLMLIVVLIGAYNTIVRYLDSYLQLDSPLSSNIYIELQWCLFGVIFLMGAAYTLRRDSHVRVDVLYDRLPVRWRAMINMIGIVVLMLPFCILVLVFSIEPVLESWRIREQSPNPGGLPYYLIKTVIPVAFLLLSLQGLSEFVKQLDRFRSGIGANTAGSPEEAHL